ncbi:MAG: protein translocase subunit SecD [Pseudomonadota bacterium]|uniref:Protein translocase subunit SecD n=1 Tax=Candidatus Desulfatibia profunda TaxID=2841695 RepID=A0A8J6NS76_9BACT|nr:protein translocase subunit SecD [Candidatus Desulfatibia profunda]MBL7179352.1 protein translocase subunit SecD [Desulfobacterales bacterium]
MKTISWRLVSVVVVIGTALVYLLPSIKPTLWPHKKINLGLDLQGGMHLALEVDTEKAVESTVERITQELRSLMKTEQIKHGGIKKMEGHRLAVRLQDQKDIDAFEKLLDKEFKDLRMLSKSTEDGILTVVMDLPERESAQIKKLATEQALETIRNRIDQFGVSEPDIRLQGEKRILIQLPGIKDTQRAKDLIGRTALLEFKLLDETHDVNAALQGDVPPDSEILYETKEDPQTRREIKTPYLVKKQTLLTGAHLTDAKIQIDSQYNEPYVSLTFDKKGGRDFARITEANVKKRLAIVLDKNVYSAPVIQEKITGGQARITGRFTTDEAHDLAIVLRAGALPAPVNILEERTVGPSLGSDSIRKGLVSMCVGGLLVIAFMLVYYKGSGLIADLALILNIILIAGGLAAFQATLTLPGIAGIILTIGMAVDANVLIFERIREEMNLGKTPRAAVDAGYDRATLTILDANVTTLIAALVLFQFGTGPVKGFAVTLSLGVISSMYTALILTRLVFDYFLTNRKIRRLSI